MKRIWPIFFAVAVVVIAGCSGPKIEKKDPSGAADPEAETSASGKSKKAPDMDGN